MRLTLKPSLGVVEADRWTGGMEPSLVCGGGIGSLFGGCCGSLGLCDF